MTQGLAAGHVHHLAAQGGQTIRHLNHLIESELFTSLRATPIFAVDTSEIARPGDLPNTGARLAQSFVQRMAAHSNRTPMQINDSLPWLTTGMLENRHSSLETLNNPPNIVMLFL